MGGVFGHVTLGLIAQLRRAEKRNASRLSTDGAARLGRPEAKAASASYRPAVRCVHQSADGDAVPIDAVRAIPGAHHILHSLVPMRRGVWGPLCGPI